jgi:NADH:ubiquinone oxidoreductase subunit F (NADH-binding)
VLVNPTELPLDVPMETPFRRILGVHATGVNDGTVSSTMHIPGGDALFLLRAQIDNVRPAAVNDLRVGP